MDNPDLEKWDCFGGCEAETNRFDDGKERERA
jgi:hypothetical protein